MAIEILDDRHRKLAEELLRGTPRTHIAKDLGVARATLYEWMRDPLWQAYFQKLAGEREEAASARMLVTITKAGEVMDAYLERILDALENPSASMQVPGVPVGALPTLEAVSEVLKRLVDLQRVGSGRPTEHRRLETTSPGPAAKERGRKVKGALDRLLDRDTDEEDSEPKATH